MTNADKIRAMSDEDMAHTLEMNIVCDLCQAKAQCTSDKTCEAALLEWLRQPNVT